MGDEPATPVDPEFAKLRKKFLEEKVFKYQPILNAMEDPNWGKPVHIPIGDKTWEFRKFSHAEVTMLTGLPYFSKLLSLQPLTDEEKVKWHQAQKEMVEAVSSEPRLWSDYIVKNESLVEKIFIGLLSVSQVDIKKLDEFFASDYGANYGYMWFLVMGRTPTEVGALAESDYQAVNSYFRMNAERMKKK